MRTKSLNWQGYKKIRSQLLAALSGEIGDALRDVVTACDGLQSKGLALTAVSVAAASGILARVPALLVDVESRMEDLATDLIQAICPNVVIDEMNVFDVLSLRRLVLDSIDLGGLLDAEKNLLGGIYRSVMQTITGGTVETPDANEASKATATDAAAPDMPPGSTGTNPTGTDIESGGPAGKP